MKTIKIHLILICSFLLIAISCSIFGKPSLSPDQVAATTLAATPRVSGTLLASHIPPGTVTLAATFTPTPTVPPNKCALFKNPLQVGLVTEVLSGDTIVASIDGVSFTVRYQSIEAPDVGTSRKPGQHFNEQAKAKNQELVWNKVIVLAKDITDVDADGRLLRYVFIGSLDGLFVNYELVRQGYARVAVDLPDVACSPILVEAQTQAKLNLLGMWAPTPVPSLTPAK